MVCFGRVLRHALNNVYLVILWAGLKVVLLLALRATSEGDAGFAGYFGLLCFGVPRSRHCWWLVVSGLQYI